VDIEPYSQDYLSKTACPLFGQKNQSVIDLVISVHKTPLILGHHLPSQGTFNSCCIYLNILQAQQNCLKVGQNC
jgi:hypothetical protein